MLTVEKTISAERVAIKVALRALALCGVATVFAFFPDQSAAQNATGAEATSDVSVEANPQSGAQSSSGGNVFDFSNNSGRNTPPGPNLPSFAGGPCMGVSGGVSAAGPGFAIGGGRSYEDEACQRRNWVQTLIGVSQHMPEVEANELKRLAIAVMMQDEYLAPAFASLGYNPVVPPGAQQQPAASSSQNIQSQRSRRAQIPSQVAPAAMASGCVVVVPANASAQFKSLVARRGCQIRTR